MHEKGFCRSNSTMGMSTDGKFSRAVLLVSKATGVLSASMYASRSRGRLGSRGTYAPPAFDTASSATTISRLRSMQIATRSSGRTLNPVS